VRSRTELKGEVMALRIKNGEKILFIGDSITDCGRRDAAAPLGNGYVKLFNDLLIGREPEKRITIINKGIGGDNVVGLKNRWTDDVLRHSPDWLSIKIGINDLHSTFGNPAGVHPKVYAEAYDDILARTRKALPKCRILLIQPFYISIESAPNTWRRQVQDLLPAYLNIVAGLHRKYGTRIVKTHALYQHLLRYHDADAFCGEPVHPNPTGHLVIAEAVYSALSA
jgi:lysophospholipase L1-like esterase